VEISFLGANALALNTKTAKIIVDPAVPGLKVDAAKADIILLTQPFDISPKESQLVINTPGEYEAKTISIKGIASRAHVEDDGQQGATIYRIDTPAARVGIVGHIHPSLSDEQLEALGTLDVLIVPVGGHGYTLDAEGAAQVVRAIEPRVVIPTHFADKSIKYEVPQSELKEFTDELGVPLQEEQRYKIKPGSLPEQLTVVVLSRTS